MRISSFRITNYKSFASSEDIPLSPGFNVILGKNNVGKTALVEALSLTITDRPHRSLKTVPYPGATPSAQSQVNITFSINRDELLRLLVDRLPNFHVPKTDRYAGNLEQSFISTLQNDNSITCVFNPSPSFVLAYLNGANDITADISTNTRTLHFTISRDNLQLKLVNDSASAPIRDTLAYQLANMLRDRIYLFRAERLNVGQSAIAGGLVLKPDASNLPQVLHYLQSTNPSRYGKLVRLIEIIFPEITYITVPIMPDDPGQARVFLWTIDPNTEREDLAIPLQESGTGIGQVLAMLFLVLTSDFPRTIIIDEPQSFLHPGAIRKLFEILQRDYPQHQYIVTTHSPTAITAVNPRTIIVVHKERAESIVEQVDISETQRLRLFLSEVGARLADVFGADNILWVEGATEEQCFPLIIEKLAKKLLLGTTILGVKHTGDFRGKHKQLVLDIYTRLSEGRGLLPPAVGFVFDQEGLTDRDREDLIRPSKGRVFFLNRRMYENYLLNPAALAAVLSSLDKNRSTPVTAQEIEQWLDQKGCDTKYISSPPGAAAERNEAWFHSVDAAKLLKDMFTELSEMRVAYDNKPAYGRMLTEWLIEHSPDDLADVVSLLQQVLAEGKW